MTTIIRCETHGEHRISDETISGYGGGSGQSGQMYCKDLMISVESGGARENVPFGVEDVVELDDIPEQAILFYMGSLHGIIAALNPGESLSRRELAKMGINKINSIHKSE